MIIIDLMADLFQFGCRLSTILKAMQMNLHPKRGQGTNLKIHIDHPPIIGRKRNIE
jgi:hypothetical protein